MWLHQQDLQPLPSSPSGAGKRQVGQGTGVCYGQAGGRQQLGTPPLHRETVHRLSVAPRNMDTDTPRHPGTNGRLEGPAHQQEGVGRPEAVWEKTGAFCRQRLFP